MNDIIKAAMSGMGEGVALGLIIGVIVALVRGDGGAFWKRTLESVILGGIGGAVAAAGVTLMIAEGPQSEAWRLLVLWGAMPILGLVETPIVLFSDPVMSSPKTLTWIASSIAAFTGAANGAGKIYNWKGLGLLAFPLDISWGLSGSSLGALLHIVNTGWSTYPGDKRTNAHRYSAGFQLVANYALTLGSAMSGLTSNSGGLYNHEMLHVWQSRIFGPIFPISYGAWAAVMFIPGLIAGPAVKASPSTGMVCYTYLNNPWEMWAYLLGGWRGWNGTNAEKLIWTGPIAVIWAIIFALATLAGTLGLFAWVWE